MSSSFLGLKKIYSFKDYGYKWGPWIIPSVGRSSPSELGYMPGVWWIAVWINEAWLDRARMFTTWTLDGTEEKARQKGTGGGQEGMCESRCVRSQLNSGGRGIFWWNFFSSSFLPKQDCLVLNLITITSNTINTYHKNNDCHLYVPSICRFFKIIFSLLDFSYAH